MSDDARYLIDLFEMQYEMFKKSMLDKQLRNDKFDRYSYSATAIELILNDIRECTSYKDVSLIRQIITLHLEMYDTYLKRSKEAPKRFTYAFKATNYLYSLTGGYLND